MLQLLPPNFAFTSRASSWINDPPIPMVYNGIIQSWINEFDNHYQHQCFVSVRSICI